MQRRHNTWRYIASLLITGVVTLVAVAAQAPQRGPAPPAAPNPLGQPLLDPAGQVREDAFYKVPLAPEDRKYADLDGMKMKAVVREAAAISQERQGERHALLGP